MEKGVNKYSVKFRIYIFVLAYAFFCLVISDLIIIHQKIITGHDLYSKRQLFIKPNKPSKKRYSLAAHSKKNTFNDTPTGPSFPFFNVIDQYKALFPIIENSFEPHEQFIIQLQGCLKLLIPRGPPLS